MSAKTKIEWTDATWNPLVAYRGEKRGWHCEKISPACHHCYAAAMNKRSDGLVGIGTGLPYAAEQRSKLKFQIDGKTLLAPLGWKRPRKIFVCSMTDLFGDWWTDEQIDKVFAVMALCPHYAFQVLTKRPQRMLRYLTTHHAHGYTKFDDVRKWMHLLSNQMKPESGWPLPNVWLGVTAENQERADERIPLLLETPAATRFLSVEPMLGPVNVSRFMFRDIGWQNAGGPSECAHGYAAGIPCRQCTPSLDWVIAGGESGPGARPSHPDWFRSLRDQCVAAGVPYFHKQNGEYAWVGRGHGGSDDVEPKAVRVGKKRAGRLLDGRNWEEFPQ
jgi:protein gp37